MDRLKLKTFIDYKFILGVGDRLEERPKRADMF